MRYTARELEELRAREGSKSDWARADAMTEEELEAAIASDPDEAGMVVDWSTARMTSYGPKQAVSIRLDPTVLRYFRKGGRGYQSRINAVLRAYVDQMEAAER